MYNRKPVLIVVRRSGAPVRRCWLFTWMWLRSGCPKCCPCPAAGPIPAQPPPNTRAILWQNLHCNSWPASHSNSLLLLSLMTLVVATCTRQQVNNPRALRFYLVSTVGAPQAAAAEAAALGSLWSTPTFCKATYTMPLFRFLSPRLLPRCVPIDFNALAACPHPSTPPSTPPSTRPSTSRSLLLLLVGILTPAVGSKHRSFLAKSGSCCRGAAAHACYCHTVRGASLTTQTLERLDMLTASCQIEWRPSLVGIRWPITMHRGGRRSQRRRNCAAYVASFPVYCSRQQRRTCCVSCSAKSAVVSCPHRARSAGTEALGRMRWRERE